MKPRLFYREGLWWCGSDDVCAVATTWRGAFELWEECQSTTDAAADSAVNN